MNAWSYLPHTEEDRRRMMAVLGISDIEELFDDIPEEVRFRGALQVPERLSEVELDRHMTELAGENRPAAEMACFLGAGAYDHHVPAVVDAIIGRSEFYTSYTPYQPEISQGILQAIFEYQTMVCELLGMEVSNASMYDGASATAEAALAACAATRRSRVWVSDLLNPAYRRVICTYCEAQDVEVVAWRDTDGRSSAAALNELDESVAAVVVQYPNFLGIVEPLRDFARRAHEVGALLIVAAYPVALGVLESPGACGADIAVAEGQPLGTPLSFGGPYLGLMASSRALMRRLPGRIVGQTVDTRGHRGFVLTLQAREQHIRREKATSNICSNQALNALAATVYLAALGPGGLADLAGLNLQKAHYLFNRLTGIPGVEPLIPGAPFFNEFALRLPVDPAKVNRVLLQQGILGGLDLGEYRTDWRGGWLLAVTEKRTRAEMDRLVDAVKEGVRS
ncbi:MAG TPA: aminomethyl-transferring glycine dehydrogenase subunit GcvPA [Alicyclobacillus sp.]|nr:aminomethyl-transferring glycine dehydrogenase subunit GcvPA [Alicyclobacillus sp.]